MTFDPFDHLDYRSLLRAWLDARPTRSQTSIARRVGTSRSSVAMVLAGQRDLAHAAAPTWCRAMGLEGTAKQYFELLVQAESPVSHELGQAAQMQAAALRAEHRAHRPTREQAALLGQWFVPVILVLARSAAFVPEGRWLASRIWPPVDEHELDLALRGLVELGILTSDGSRTVVDLSPIATNRQLSDELSRIGRAYHEHQLAHAAAALDLDADRRHFGSLTVGIRSDRIGALAEALHRFQLEVIEPFRAGPDADAVVQVSVQMFPRTV